MGKILIIAGTRSLLQRRRGLIGLSFGYQLIWYSGEFDRLDNHDSIIKIKALHGHFNHPVIRKILFLLEPFHIFFIIKKYKIDLVHVQWANRRWAPYGFPSKVPVILSVMGGDILPERSYRGFINRWTICKMIRRANKITTKSEYMDQAIRQIDPGSTEKIIRVNWGIDPEQFKPGLNTDKLRKKLNIHDRQIVYFDMRNAKPLYRKELIIHAFADVLRSVDSVLLISERVGKKDYLKQLHQLAKNLGIDSHVRFLGAINHDEMPLYYNMADIGISIPMSDGLPQSLFEMMACGTFPVLSNLEQYQEVFPNGEGAQFVAIDDIKQDSYELVESLISCAKDKKRREDACIRNRQWVKKHAVWDVQRNELNNLYSELIN